MASGERRAASGGWRGFGWRVVRCSTHELVATLLEAHDDLAREATLDAVRLDHQVGALGVSGHCEEDVKQGGDEHVLCGLTEDVAQNPPHQAHDASLANPEIVQYHSISITQ
eukprot:COSAG02_NODE_287_length_25647_cov_245.259316_5_plen_112_part_00